MTGPALVAGTVVGGTVVGGTVVGGTVVGGTVVGGTVVGGTVVGVVSGVGVGVAVVAVAVGVADFEVVGVLLVFVAAGVVFVAAGVVAVVPGVDALDDGCTTGPTVVPVVVVCGLTRALMSGESPVTVPDRLVEPPIAFGLPPELPLALACATACDSPGTQAGQLAALQAMNPLAELPDWDALVPYQQMSVMAPSTPVPISRFRTECGR
ncbi:MAG TPA: hypothetical protein VGI66_10950 [Streptosporangiaceae bacterium]